MCGLLPSLLRSKLQVAAVQVVMAPGGLGGRGGFGFCGIAVLLFASRFGHDPLLDVPDDGRHVTARI